MGFFNRKANYPELAEDTQAAKQIHAIECSLKELIGQISEPLEIVPAEGHVFVFIGKPPKRFGMAKVGERIHSLGAAAREHGMHQIELQKLNIKLHNAYLHCHDAPRYKISVDGKAVVVTPSQQLAREVGEITNSLFI